MDRFRTIGLLMDYVLPGVIDGAGAYAREHGLRLDARWSVRADWMPEEVGWDGLVVHLLDADGVHRRVRELDRPAVYLGGWRPGAAPRVEPNYPAMAALAVEEFRELGLEQVAAIDTRRNPVSRHCFLALRVAARRAGMAFASIPYPSGLTTLHDGVRRVADELAAIAPPVGLFVPHAGFTFSLLDELAEREVRVPEDVAVIVIDKDVQRTAELAPVSLTGVIPDDWQQGYEATRMVHRILAGQPLERRIIRIAPAGIARRQSTGTETTRDPVVAKALHGLEAHPLADLSVTGLAAFAGVSRRTLEQRFRRETGRTVHGAITRRRIGEAKRLLHAASLTVADVAEATGHSSVHYFTTAFKRETGQTPGGYRKGGGSSG